MAQLAGQHHGSFAAANPKFTKFPDFLDAFASAWLQQKAEIEEEAQKHGFVPCASTLDIRERDRRQVALLALSLRGSFVFLGNGCLSPGGSSGHYTKIPLRKSEGPTKFHAQSGICVQGEANIGHSLYFRNIGEDEFMHKSSALQLLYYTTQTISPEDELVFEDAISERVSDCTEQIRGSTDETVRNPSPQSPKKWDDQPIEVPQRPQRQPMY